MKRHATRSLRHAAIGAVLFMGLATGATTARAAIVNVNTLVDEFSSSNNGRCSLREAVHVINNNLATYGGCVTQDDNPGVPGIQWGTDAITLTVPGDYVLTRGTLVISSSFNLSGSDPDNNGYAIYGNDSTATGIKIVSPATDTTISKIGMYQFKATCLHLATAAQLNIIEGDFATCGRTDSTFSGGGIVNEGVMVLTGSRVAYNLAGAKGGGIYNKSVGTLVLEDTYVYDNFVSTGSGGGIHNEGELRIDRGGVYWNTAQTSGGGVYTKHVLRFNGNHIRDCLMMGNFVGTRPSSPAGSGGGLYVSDSSTVRMAVGNTNLSDNTAAQGPSCRASTSKVTNEGGNTVDDPSLCPL